MSEKASNSNRKKAGTKHNKPYSKVSSSAAVLKILRGNPEGTYTPRQLHTMTGVSLPLIYSIASSSPEIKSLDRGVYQYRSPTELPLNDPEIPFLSHGVRIVRKGGSPPQSCKVHSGDSITLLNRDHREALLQVHKHSIELTVSCSENPLEAVELALLLESVDCQQGTDILTAPENWTVTNIDNHKDMAGYHLAGGNLCSVKPMSGILLKAYNKHNVLRVEACIHQEIPMPDILAFFQGAGTSIQNAEALQIQKELLKELRRFNENNIRANRLSGSARAGDPTNPTAPFKRAREPTKTDKPDKIVRQRPHNIDARRGAPGATKSNGVAQHARPRGNETERNGSRSGTAPSKTRARGVTKRNSVPGSLIGAREGTKRNSEKQGGPVPQGTVPCPRCGQALDNTGPGSKLVLTCDCGYLYDSDVVDTDKFIKASDIKSTGGKPI